MRAPFRATFARAEPPRRWHLAGRLAGRFAAALLGCLVALIIAEVALRVSGASRDRFYLWPPNSSTTFHLTPGIIRGVRPEGQIRINSQGIRGPEWSTDRAGEYRVLAIGGSTTECLFLDQGSTWPALLHEQLGATADGRRVWVGNLGKAGLNSRDHLALMRLVIDQYDVDAVVVLLGGNDMVHRLMQGGAYDPWFTEDERRYSDWLRPRFASVPPAWAGAEVSVFERTALWGVGKELMDRYLQRTSPGTIVLDDAGDWLVAVRQARQRAPLVDELPPLESGLHEYERNVERIVDEARRRKLRIVLVTQPTRWEPAMPKDESDELWWGWQPGGSFYTTAALARAMDSYNQRLLATCARLAVECIDMASRLPRTPEIFYDDIHFTEAGAERFASELSAHLLTRAPFSGELWHRSALQRGGGPVTSMSGLPVPAAHPLPR